MNYPKLFTLMIVLFFSAKIASAQIQAGRAIKITISGVPDTEKSQINNDYPVSDNGIINMPYIGQIRAAGLRNEQLSDILQRSYRNAGIYTNPTIQVITTAVDGGVNQETVTIGGQIRKTGPIPFYKGITLWEAIQTAGGPTDFGTMRRVRLRREGQSKEYNLNNTQYREIQLLRNDSIEIPQKRPFEPS
jgi:protein involved in polysaccharide export with SLBB domain